MHVRLFFGMMTLSVAVGIAACGSGSSESSGVAGSGGGGGPAGATGAAGQSGGAGAGGSSSVTPGVSGPNGLFEVHYMSESPIADIGGLMWDAPKPEAVIWDKKKTEGACSLYQPRTPFCESCAATEVCVDTNVCRPQAVKRSAGAITMSGLKSTAQPLPLTLTAEDTAPSYLSPETLSLPPCTVGSPVQLDAAGAGEYPAFSVKATCIEPLVVPSQSMPIESGKPFVLTWTPGTVADARVTLEFDLSHHGGSKGQIRCEGADNGSLEVSAALVKSLLDLGVTGFPWLTVERVVKGTTPVGSGQAQLKIYSERRIDLQVPGLTSCNQDSDCATGETCLNTSNMCGIACTTNAECPTGKTCQTSTKSCK